jgi:predicted transcriptional regulator
MGKGRVSSFLTEAEGFTPVIDVVVKDVGLMSAVVYGIVWRHCQMRDEICRASLETLSEMVGCDRATIKRHITNLCERGYLEDTTPTRRNRPHVYRDTGKAHIIGLVKAGHAESMTQVMQRVR